MTLYFFIVFGFYFSLLIALWVGWQLTFEKPEQKRETDSVYLSVIVPYCNEQANLKPLVQSLLAQNYPKEQVEIIFVNDHSTDDSFTLLNELTAGFAHVKNLSLPEVATGKKRALTLGIQAASHGVIITTDADCVHDPEWLASIASSFQSSDCVMAVGGVRIEPSASLFARLQALEFTSLIGTTAGTLFYKRPTMCNGANLAFRKSAFLEVSGYDGNLEIASGDDEFLMRKIDKRFPRGIVFLTEKKSVVTTRSASTLNEFFQQRIRWASKWSTNPSLATKLLAVFIFLFQFSYVLLPIVGLLGWLAPKSLSLLVVTKLALEFLFLYQVSFFLQIRWRWIPFLLLQVLYPFYVMWVGLKAQGHSVRWKDRVV